MTTEMNNFFMIRLLAPMLLFLPIPPIIKIFLALLMDNLDSSVYKMLVDKSYNTKTFQYQSYDKIVDLYTEAFIILYMISFKIVNYKFYNSLGFLLLLRTIGTMLFLQYNKTIYLKIFPDALREYLLLTLLADYFPVSWKSFLIKNNLYIVILIYAIKALFECYWHKTEYPMN